MEFSLAWRMTLFLLFVALLGVTQAADNDTATPVPDEVTTNDPESVTVVDVVEVTEDANLVTEAGTTELGPDPDGHEKPKEDKPEQEPSAPALRVAGIKVYPYLFDNPNATENTTENDLYTGFIKELMDALCADMGKDYTLQLADGYGKLVGGKWTGAIGEVVEGKADVAAGPLTVTLERETAVDFTWPFQRFEATIVMAKRHPDQEPRITSLQDLLNQDIVEYGVSENGAIHNFLKDSEEDVHKRMLDYVRREMGRLRENNNDGVERARADNQFAFLLEGPAANFVLNQPPCDLMGISAGFYGRQYALAVSQKSDLRESLNAALVNVQYSGVMGDLKRKWLEKGECADAASLPLISYVTVLCCALAALFMSSSR